MRVVGVKVGVANFGRFVGVRVGVANFFCVNQFILASKL